MCLGYLASVFHRTLLHSRDVKPSARRSLASQRVSQAEIQADLVKRTDNPPWLKRAHTNECRATTSGMYLVSWDAILERQARTVVKRKRHNGTCTARKSGCLTAWEGKKIEGERSRSFPFPGPLRPAPTLRSPFLSASLGAKVKACWPFRRSHRDICEVVVGGKGVSRTRTTDRPTAAIPESVDSLAQKRSRFQELCCRLK